MKNFPKILALHKETQKDMRIPMDERGWPPSWKVVEYKEYPRFPCVVLPPVAEPKETFASVLKGRKSSRNFDSSGTLSLSHISDFLHWGAGLREPVREGDPMQFARRFYPSGGGRYSLEVYMSFRGNDELPRGIYHYNVKKHSLERLLGEDGDKEVRALPTYPWAPDAAAIFFITGMFERNMRKYRERGYRFVHLEAGAILHNFYIVASALGIGMCGLGSNFDKEVDRILDVDPAHETMLTCFAAGPLRDGEPDGHHD